MASASTSPSFMMVTVKSMSSPMSAAVLDAVTDLMPMSAVDTSFTMFMASVDVALLLLVSVSLKSDGASIVTVATTFSPVALGCLPRSH